MIIILKQNLTHAREEKLRKFLAEKNVEVIPVRRAQQTLLVVVGRFPELTKRDVSQHEYVESIIDIDRPYKLASKSFKTVNSEIKINNTCTIGAKEIILMAGPC